MRAQEAGCCAGREVGDGTSQEGWPMHGGRPRARLACLAQPIAPVAGSRGQACILEQACTDPAKGSSSCTFVCKPLLLLLLRRHPADLCEHARAADLSRSWQPRAVWPGKCRSMC